MMTGWTYAIVASIAISTTTLLFWYRFLRSKEWALAVSVLTVLLLAPLITFFSLEYRLGFEWSELEDSPAGGLAVAIGAMETFAIWVGSIAIAVVAHFLVMDRYSRIFEDEDDESEIFE